jgi:excinuclease ABC subunit A
MSSDSIHIVGAREHNLKNISLSLPRNKLVVITGLSGSGKSSLAFDTLFAEGQRRYVESLSTYARQYLGQLRKPDVDLIEGLSPAVAIDQRGVSANPRSTVGTLTEIYDFLRLLYARLGTPHCPTCGREVQRQSSQEIVAAVQALPGGTRFVLLAPVVRGRKGMHQAAIEEIRQSGFVRMRIDGSLYDAEAEVELDPHRAHSVEAVVDRLVIPAADSPAGERSDFETRLADSIETALRIGQGYLALQNLSLEPPQETTYSEHFACSFDGTSLPVIEPSTFSFNSPHGACPECQGLGTRLEIDIDRVISDRSLPLSEAAASALDLAGSDRSPGGMLALIEALAEAEGFDLDQPLSLLGDTALQGILRGTGEKKVRVTFRTGQGRSGTFDTPFEGLVPALQRRYRETTSAAIREKIEALMSERTCEACGGRRLRREALGVTIAGQNIVDICEWTTAHLRQWIGELAAEGKAGLTSPRQQRILAPILAEIRGRLQFLEEVGLDYLTLERSAASLSGGEAQRIRMATQIGSRLSGVLYVLDEPSVGLHPRDTSRLLASLARLRDLGNTVLVVEHDEATIRSADWVVDLGPGAGPLGGHVVGQGTPTELARQPKSITGQWLAGKLGAPAPHARRPGNGQALTIVGARANNLKNITVRIPLGKLICLSGVSGSGKSTLLIDVLYEGLVHGDHPGEFQAAERIEGAEQIEKVIHIDQSPIGRTPRSNPATYIGLYGEIRELFATLPAAKVRGYRPGRFSFNVRGGRCEACQGQGQIQVSMQFLPDVYVPCEVCNGTRFNRETLQVLFKERSIAQVLDQTAEESRDLFAAFPNMVRKLDTLSDVGLGYIRLGQSAVTLSGGEAQRIKLARELSRRPVGQTLYVLDEPTVGLHAADVQRLIPVLERLVDEGHTVVVIEHNLDILRMADHIIDLGPEGGDQGGRVVAEGTPEDVADVSSSYTGQYLRPVLEAPAPARPTGRRATRPPSRGQSASAKKRS